MLNINIYIYISKYINISKIKKYIYIYIYIHAIICVHIWTLDYYRNKCVKEPDRTTTPQFYGKHLLWVFVRLLHVQRKPPRNPCPRPRGVKRGGFRVVSVYVCSFRAEFKTFNATELQPRVSTGSATASWALWELAQVELSISRILARPSQEFLWGR